MFWYKNKIWVQFPFIYLKNCSIFFFKISLIEIFSLILKFDIRICEARGSSRAQATHELFGVGYVCVFLIEMKKKTSDIIKKISLSFVLFLIFFLFLDQTKCVMSLAISYIYSGILGVLVCARKSVSNTNVNIWLGTFCCFRCRILYFFLAFRRLCFLVSNSN